MRLCRYYPLVPLFANTGVQTDMKTDDALEVSLAKSISKWRGEICESGRAPQDGGRYLFLVVCWNSFKQLYI